MRKRAFLLITALLTFMSVSVNAQTETGDLNGDGNVNKGDLTCLIYKILRLEEGDDTYDVNNDGKVDITDVTSLIGIIVSNNQEKPFLISENNVGLFVNTYKKVVIEMGNGEYELQNKHTEIFEAELIMADKNDDPDAKDEIKIYGIADGVAQLEVLDVKSNRTATIVVNVNTLTENDLENINNYVASVTDFVSLQEDNPIDVFQDNLFSWLEDKDWVKNISYNANNDLINVTFENGANLHLQFQDLSFYDNEDVQSDLSRKKSEEEDNFYDVTYKEGEEIIENTNTLYIQGRKMGLDNSKSELSHFIDAFSQSPVKISYKLYKHSISFLDEDFSKYGMIIISQTHGGGKWQGAFQVETDDWLTWLSRNFDVGITYYIENGRLHLKENSVYLWVEPTAFDNKKVLKNSILYANYCWSYDMSHKNYIFGRNDSHVVGFADRSNYFSNEWGLCNFYTPLLNGDTFDNAYLNDKNGFHMLAKPTTNKSDSKLRYFSVKTALATPGNLQTYWTALGGYVYGINNLKKEDIVFKMWYSEKPFEKPNNNMDYYAVTIDDRNGCQYGSSFYDRWDISTDGKIVRILKYFPLSTRTGQNKLYSCLGFEYNGKIYHGDVRELTY